MCPCRCFRWAKMPSAVTIYNLGAPGFHVFVSGHKSASWFSFLNGVGLRAKCMNRMVYQLGRTRGRVLSMLPTYAHEMYQPIIWTVFCQLKYVFC